jgi:hypothetical protein
MPRYVSRTVLKTKQFACRGLTGNVQVARSGWQLKAAGLLAGVPESD